MSEPDEREDDEPTEVLGEEGAPPLPTPVLLAVVGVLCGFASVVLVWLSERGCVAVRDTPNCGALGFPLLIVTVVITVILGTTALRRLYVPSPALVAFLGVVFMLLVVVGLLADRLLTPWSILVVPAITGATFVLAHFVSSWLDRASP